MIETVTKVKLTNYHSLPVKMGQVFQVGEQEVVIIKLTDGSVKAIENRSPHPKGGTLVDGLISGSFIYCPCYDWKISLEDGFVQDPDNGRVKTYNVIIEEDTVSILI
jgi:nitrite reductase (NADH) small subunit